VTDFGEALALCTPARKGRRSGLIPASTNNRKLAIVRGCDLRPLAELIEHFVGTLGELAWRSRLRIFTLVVLFADTWSDMHRILRAIV
jgi:hypothetical protein